MDLTDKSDFRVQKRLWHLTYKTHIEFSKILELVSKPKTRLIGYSFVHELGSCKEDHSQAYAHTHVALIYEKSINMTNSRYWDVGDIHPHFARATGMKWMQNLFDKYHKGFKKDKKGRPLFVEPVLLEQKIPESFEFERERLLAIRNAESLIDACVVGEIQPRSVSDVVALRNDKRRRISRAKYALKDFPWEPLDTSKKAQVVHGAPGIGKTQFALAHFTRPLLVSTTDELKKFHEGFHDGIVFDDMEFFEWKRTTQIHLTDMDNDRTIRCRNTDAFIPEGTPRIFTGNYRERIFDFTDGAVARRTRVHHLVLLEKWGDGITRPTGSGN